MLRRIAARLVTGPFAFLLSWVIDVAILFGQLYRARRRPGW